MTLKDSIDPALGPFYFKLNEKFSLHHFSSISSSFHFEQKLLMQKKIIKSYLRSYYLHFIEFSLFFSGCFYFFPPFLYLLRVESYFKMCWLCSRQCDRINNNFRYFRSENLFVKCVVLSGKID